MPATISADTPVRAMGIECRERVPRQPEKQGYAATRVRHTKRRREYSRENRCHQRRPAPTVFGGLRLLTAMPGTRRQSWAHTPKPPEAHKAADSPARVYEEKRFIREEVEGRREAVDSEKGREALEKREHGRVRERKKVMGGSENAGG